MDALLDALVCWLWGMSKKVLVIGCRLYFFDGFGVDYMSGAIKSVMEFEEEMDGTFNSAVIGFLDLLEYHHQSSAKWGLRGQELQMVG